MPCRLPRGLLPHSARWQTARPPPSDLPMTTPRDLWDRYRRLLVSPEPLGFSLDVSRMDLDEAFFRAMDGPARKALADMDALEKGAIANPDEKRMVGHYWLRAADLAPSPEIRQAIT